MKTTPLVIDADMPSSVTVLIVFPYVNTTESS